MNVYTDKDTNLVLAPDGLISELSEEVEKWSALDDVFKTVNSLATMVIVEWKLNQLGLTCYDHREDITKFDRMDKVYEGMTDANKQRWCGFFCRCRVGEECVSNISMRNHITYEQWNLWRLSRFRKGSKNEPQCNYLMQLKRKMIDLHEDAID